MASTLWSKENRTTISPAVAAKALGYQMLSGPARVKLSALKKFGLLDEIGKDGLRLSDLAMSLIHHSADSEEYQQALREAALRPELFRELYQSHGKASEDALRSHLVVKKAFSDPGARQAITAFRDTVALANLNGEGYTSGGIDNKPMQEASTGVQERSNVANPKMVSAGPSARTYAFDISIPREVKGELRIVGQFGKDDLERLRKALNGQLAMIEAALED